MDLVRCFREMLIYWHQLQGSGLLLEMVMMTEVTSCVFPDPTDNNGNLHNLNSQPNSFWVQKSNEALSKTFQKIFSGNLEENRSVASEHASYDSVLTPLNVFKWSVFKHWSDYSQGNEDKTACLD